MSRSNHGRSDLAARIRRSEDAAHPDAVPHHPSRRRRWKIRIAAFFRWIHIYLSMFSLAVILFFSVTGITLNHPDWFFDGAEGHRQVEGRVEMRWLGGSGAQGPSSGTPDPDPAFGVDKLAIVEHLRASHGVRGALTDFRIDEYECSISFKGPGYNADVFLDRETGRYTLTETYRGVVAVLNDLHKGRDTGPVWSVVIDVSAVFMTIVSLTGLVLLFYLKLRRAPGLWVVLAGTIAAVVIAWRWVPF